MVGHTAPSNAATAAANPGDSSAPHVAHPSVRSAQSREFLLQLGGALRPLGEPAQVEERACSMLAEYLQVGRAYYVEIDEQANRLSVARDAVRWPATTHAGVHLATDFSWAYDNLRGGHSNVVNNTQKSMRIPHAQRKVCAALQIVACIAAPVLKGQQLVGALCVTDTQPRRWKAREVALVREIADHLWCSLMRTRADEQLIQRARALERQAAQLRRLASELTLAEHHTRQQLSRVLHDGLQQQLFCASLTLDGAIKASGGYPLLHRAQAELKDAMEVTRSLSVDLFPPVLHNDRLPDALEWLVAWARKKYALVVKMRVDPDADPTASHARILLFESVRELIFNAVKHARVSEAALQLSLQAQDMVQIVVSDEGVGFDPRRLFSGAGADAGLGLFSIRERLVLLGGDLTIDSAPGRGARFELRVPRQACGGEA